MSDNEVHRKIVGPRKRVKNSRYDTVVLPRKPRLASMQIK